jgi:hypothetical protein
MSSNLLHPTNFNASSHTHNSASLNTLTSQTPSIATRMAVTPTISTSERRFWIGMRVISIILSLGSLIISLLSLRDNVGLSYFTFIAVATSFSVSLPHLVTLPSRYSRNPHTPPPNQRFLLDTVSWVLFLLQGVSMISYHFSRHSQYLDSRYDDYELPWDVKLVIMVVFYLGGAVVHLIGSVYDLVDMRKAASMSYVDEEEGTIVGKGYLSGGMRA